MSIEQQFEVLCIHLSIAVKHSMDPSLLRELLRDGPRLSNANRRAHTQPFRAEDDCLPLSQGPCCLSRGAIHGSIVDHDDAIDPSWDRFDHIDDAGGLIALGRSRRSERHPARHHGMEHGHEASVRPAPSFTERVEGRSCSEWSSSPLRDI